MLVVVGAAACAAAPTPPEAPNAQRAGAPAGRTEALPRLVVTPDSASSIPELYAQANAWLEQGEFARAARAFDRIVRLDPRGALAADAQFQAAIAHEEAGDLSAAVTRFEQLGRAYPEHALAREALVRSVRVFGHLEEWQRAERAADVLFARYADLGPFEGIVAHAAKGMGLLQRDDLDRAQHYIEKGRSIVEEHRLDGAGRIPRDLAQLYFALGEVRRKRATAIRFHPLPDDFAAALERRCQLLLDAQSAYSDSMRAYDAHWSAMAGYRVGELYKDLHDELMRIPPPASAGTEPRRQLFEGAMRLRYSILLRKAATMMQHTIAMARRTGEVSPWVLKAEQAERDLEQAISAEDAAIDRLPHSRAELQAALDELAARKR